ncbi:MAG: hypothetical protein M1133_12800 [Armatimonadetes bacterium]|nr:hypothetical protein [Armatimonadota bacterium]
MQCEYWYNEDNADWCDLANSGCTCAGKEVNCALNGKSISAALREQEKMTLQEESLRARKRRMKAAS